VISENLWRRTFTADPNILGQTVVIAGNKKTIVGVLPPGFSILPWDMHIDVWLAIDPAWSLQIRWLPKIGRLKPGVTLEQAQAELTAIAHGMNQRQDADAEWSIRVEPLQTAFAGEARDTFISCWERWASFCSSPARMWPTFSCPAAPCASARWRFGRPSEPPGGA